MNNEQIIIDGVDVSGCSLYRNGICINYRTDDGYDKCNAICDYASYELRQTLKRKEQECEKWKHQAELGLDTTNRLAKQLEEKEQEIDYCREKLHKQLDQLKAENEELKKYGNHCFEPNSFKCKNAFFIDEKLKQALQDIKEIAEVNKNCKFEITKGICIGDTVELKLNALELILQKISEVESDF